jgi:hypothetical protein
MYVCDASTPRHTLFLPIVLLRWYARENGCISESGTSGRDAWGSPDESHLTVCMSPDSVQMGCVRCRGVVWAESSHVECPYQVARHGLFRDVWAK